MIRTLLVCNPKTMKGEVSRLVFLHILLSDKKELRFCAFPEKRIRQQLFHGLHALGESRPTHSENNEKETRNYDASNPLYDSCSLVDGIR